MRFGDAVAAGDAIGPRAGDATEAGTGDAIVAGTGDAETVGTEGRRGDAALAELAELVRFKPGVIIGGRGTAGPAVRFWL